MRIAGVEGGGARFGSRSYGQKIFAKKVLDEEIARC
jgi:hypothetical protein